MLKLKDPDGTLVSSRNAGTIIHRHRGNANWLYILRVRRLADRERDVREGVPDSPVALTL